MVRLNNDFLASVFFAEESFSNLILNRRRVRVRRNAPVNETIAYVVYTFT